MRPAGGGAYMTGGIQPQGLAGHETRRLQIVPATDLIGRDVEAVGDQFQRVPGPGVASLFGAMGMTRRAPARIGLFVSRWFDSARATREMRYFLARLGSVSPSSTLWARHQMRLSSGIEAIAFS